MITLTLDQWQLQLVVEELSKEYPDTDKSLLTLAAIRAFRNKEEAWGPQEFLKEVRRQVECYMAGR